MLKKGLLGSSVVRSGGVAAVVLAAGLGSAPAARSDVLLLDGIEIAEQSAASRPARGMSMARVESDFGAPSARDAAVGDPPITRWEYPEFIVYFEYDRVIHAVARREEPQQASL